MGLFDKEDKKPAGFAAIGRAVDLTGQGLNPNQPVGVQGDVTGQQTPDAMNLGIFGGFQLDSFGNPVK